MAAFSERALAAVSLVLRVLTLLLLLASLIIMATDKVYLRPFSDDLVDPPNFTFQDVHAYRYVVSAAVIGSTYTLLLLPFAVIHVAQGRKIGRGVARVLLIFSDAVLAVLVATGAAAGLAPTLDFLRIVPVDSEFKNFFNMVYLSCGLMLGASICMLIMITISAHLLN